MAVCNVSCWGLYECDGACCECDDTCCDGACCECDGACCAVGSAD